MVLTKNLKIGAGVVAGAIGLILVIVVIYFGFIKKDTPKPTPTPSSTNPPSSTTNPPSSTTNPPSSTTNPPLRDPTTPYPTTPYPTTNPPTGFIENTRISGTTGPTTNPTTPYPTTPYPTTPYPTTNPTTPYPTTPYAPPLLKEVYYADKGGTNESRYQFTNKNEAEMHAQSLGGTLATPAQLNDAHANGMDVCWLGWASDGQIYTISQSSHGVGSGCEGDTIGVLARVSTTSKILDKAGAWVYGVKPDITYSLNCMAPNATTPCILPFNTRSTPTKWSQYSKEVYYADKGGTNESRYQFTSKNEAEIHAQSLGGTLATPAQLNDAHANGMDVCWFGWASDGLIYTISQSSHGLGSGCEGENTSLSTIGVKSHNIIKAGAWVYGVKPTVTSYLNCMSPNATTPCILPFNTRSTPTKWSQYSKEVYYADKGGTNSTRYQFTSKNEAEIHAQSLGGTLATPAQLNDAHANGMDVCWFGWASDSRIYTISQSSHGVNSGCDGDTIGVKSHNTIRAGAWVYGIKPNIIYSLNCMASNATTPCILPFNTRSTPAKWSQYSILPLKEVYYADKGGTDKINTTAGTRYQFTSKNEAEIHAQSLGGTLATPAQLNDAHANGMDVCWFGWASDSRIYTISQSSHGVNSGCDGDTIGVKSHNTIRAGAWVYGVKPNIIYSLNCMSPNATTPCILPFNTRITPTKWSQYSKEVYYADKGGTDKTNTTAGTRYQFTSKNEAEIHAQSLGGTLATPAQLNDAHANGMDVCWFGWASDSRIYTISQSSHGVNSGCDGDTIGVKSHNTIRAGAWVYGAKPTVTSSLNCMAPNATTQCVLPFNTRSIPNKWSIY